MASDKSHRSLIGRSIFGCTLIVLTAIVGLSSGLAGAYIGTRLFNNESLILPNTTAQVVNEESAVVDVAEKTADAVVSIIITKDLPKIEEYYDNSSPFFIPRYRQNGTEQQQIGAGTGFVVTADGYIVSNRHVVSDESASYTVLMNNGERIPATVLARDTYLDIALLKIDRKELKFLSLGSSSQVKLGQHVIAIGNALGQFQNTVSAGIISGLSRTITAGDGRTNVEKLENIFQTDASINPGNSGGPLLDYAGNVIGVNVAVAQNAENISFAIPIDEVKRIIDSVVQFGEIRRPYLGVRYVPLTAEASKTQSLKYDYGAVISKGSNADEPAVVANSPAAKAGLKEGDIILEVNGEKVQDTLPALIQKYNIGDKIKLKIFSANSEKEVEVVLEEQK